MHTLFNHARAAGRQIAKEAVKSPSRNPIKRGFKTNNHKTEAEFDPKIEFSFKSEGRSSFSSPDKNCMSPVPKARRDSTKHSEAQHSVKKSLLEMLENTDTTHVKTFDKLASDFHINPGRSSMGSLLALNASVRDIVGRDSPITVQKASLHTEGAKQSAILLAGGSFGSVAANQGAKQNIVKTALSANPVKAALLQAEAEARILLGTEPTKAQIVKAWFFGSEILCAKSMDIATNIGAHNIVIKGHGPLGALLASVKKARGGSDDVNITIFQKEAFLKVASTIGQGGAEGLSILGKLIAATLFTTAIAEGKSSDAPLKNEFDIVRVDEKATKPSKVVEDGKTILIIPKEVITRYIQSEAEDLGEKSDAVDTQVVSLESGQADAPHHEPESTEVLGSDASAVHTLTMLGTW